VNASWVARRWIAVGAGLTAVGLAVAAVAPVVGTAPLGRIRLQQDAGGTMVVLGWVLLAVGIHRFGRASVPGEGPHDDENTSG
jgi:hypothetical protein